MQKGDEICGEGLSVLVLGDFPLVEWYRDTTWLAQWQPQVVKNQAKIKCVSQGVFYFSFLFLLCLHIFGFTALNPRLGASLHTTIPRRLWAISSGREHISLSWVFEEHNSILTLDGWSCPPIGTHVASLHVQRSGSGFFVILCLRTAMGSLQSGM
jgi:hypothetical protein